MKNVKLSSLPEILLAEIAHSKVGLSGYHLTKVMGPVWSASHQQVYRELNAMSCLGLLSCQAVPQLGKPDLKLYTVTEQGKKVYESMRLKEHDKASPMLFRSESVSKLAVGNWSYFESLIGTLEEKLSHANKALNDSETEFATPYEKLLLERDCLHWSAELDYARKALAFVLAGK